MSTKKPFANPDDRKRAIVLGASHMLHALISHGGLRDDCEVSDLIKQAFAVTEAFIAEAEKKL